MTVRTVAATGIRSTTGWSARVPAWAPVVVSLLVGCYAGDERVVADAERVGGGCRVVGADSRAGELALRACMSAGEQLSRILGMAAPPGVILLAVDSTLGDDDVQRRTGELWGMAIVHDAASPEFLDLGAGQQVSAGGYLTHEAAHRIAYAMLFPAAADAPAPTGPAYGSPLPDWLDEALGQLTEPEADQRARLAPLSEGSIIYALPLRRFLYMPHPALQGVPAAAPLRRVFYGQSLAFALFLQERGGADGFRGFVQAVRNGQTQGVALTSISGLPADGGELEAAWLAWLRARQSRGTVAAQHVVAGTASPRHAALEADPTPIEPHCATCAAMFAGAPPHRREPSRSAAGRDGHITFRRNA